MRRGHGSDDNEMVATPSAFTTDWSREGVACNVDQKRRFMSLKPGHCSSEGHASHRSGSTSSARVLLTWTVLCFLEGLWSFGGVGQAREQHPDSRLSAPIEMRTSQSFRGLSCFTAWRWS